MSPKRVEAPPPLDTEAILAALDRQAVEYVVIGGVAATLHGSPVATWGLDIAPAPEPENLARLAAAVRELGTEEADLAVDEAILASAGILTTMTRAGSLGICLRPAGGQGYETLVRDAETCHVFGLRVRVASLADVIRSKLALARNRDLATVPMLRELENRRS